MFDSVIFNRADKTLIKYKASHSSKDQKDAIARVMADLPSSKTIHVLSIMMMEYLEYIGVNVRKVSPTPIILDVDKLFELHMEFVKAVYPNFTYSDVRRAALNEQKSDDYVQVFYNNNNRDAYLSRKIDRRKTPMNKGVHTFALSGDWAPYYSECTILRDYPDKGVREFWDKITLIGPVYVLNVREGVNHLLVKEQQDITNLEKARPALLSEREFMKKFNTSVVVAYESQLKKLDYTKATVYRSNGGNMGWIDITTGIPHFIARKNNKIEAIPELASLIQIIR